MSRKANCYDNAVIENFFGHLKEEMFHRVRFISTDALTTHLHEYIRWYNNDRISTKLEGLSPVQYLSPGPRGIGSYLASPTIRDHFNLCQGRFGLFRTTQNGFRLPGFAKLARKGPYVFGFDEEAGFIRGIVLFRAELPSHVRRGSSAVMLVSAPPKQALSHASWSLVHSGMR